jgi:DNA-binding FadR family transcriptional regulator
MAMPQRSALADQTISWLRAQITSGAWPVGSKIPTEPELVEQLNVSRNTVREAVRALANTGLLDIRQGAGTFVLATSELAGVMHRRFADANPRHVSELRAALETAAAALAAQRRTKNDIKALNAALQRREKAWKSDDTDRFVDADAALHLTVVAASHNDVISELYADLGDVVRRFLRADLTRGLRPEQYVDHARLVQAIRDGDAETAVAEATAHPFSWESNWPT